MNFRLNIKPVLPYLRPQGERSSGLRLEANENLWGPSPEAAAAVGSLSPERLASYPEPEALARIAGRRFGAEEGGLILTNGADEAISALMAILAGRGDEIVMPVPGFGVYPLTAALHRARIRGVPLGPRFEFRSADLERAITKTTRLVILVTPNNPTGTEIRPAEIEAIAVRAARFGLPVLLDETYAGFRRRRHGRLTRRHPHLIVLGSFSKYFGLAGLRLGYVIASREVISALQTALPPYSVNAAALAAGKAALESETYYANVRREIVSERRRLASSLRGLGLTVYPSAANFLCVRVGLQAGQIRKRLADTGIFVKSFSGEPRLSECLRITVGRPEDNRRFMTALRSALPPEALIFDMDGVLVDVSESYRRAIEQTVYFFTGKPVSAAEIQKWKLRPEMNNDWDAAAAICRSRNRNVPRLEIISVFQEFCLGKNGRPGLLRSERWLPPPSVLNRLAARYRLAIVTGRPGRDARRSLRRFGTGRFFETVIALEDCGRRPKPDPYGLRLARQRLHIRRGVYFGDSPADMAAARADDMPAIAVLPPGCPDSNEWRKRMAEAGASRFAENLETALEMMS